MVDVRVACHVDHDDEVPQNHGSETEQKTREWPGWTNGQQWTLATVIAAQEQALDSTNCHALRRVPDKGRFRFLDVSLLLGLLGWLLCKAKLGIGYQSPLLHVVVRYGKA